MKFLPLNENDGTVLKVVHRDKSVLAELKHPPGGQVTLHIFEHPWTKQKAMRNGAPLGFHPRYFKNRADAQKFIKDTFK